MALYVHILMVYCILFMEKNNFNYSSRSAASSESVRIFFAGFYEFKNT